MATLVDIATKLDISVSLVSKVLNDRMGTTGVRPELMESIRNTAKEMGYQRNSSALALRQGRQNAVGIFIHSFGRPGCGNVDSLLKGISVEAKLRNQRFILDYFVEAEEFLEFGDFTSKSVMDGILIGGLPHEELMEHLLELQSSGMPIVTIFDKQMDARLPNVSFDQVEMGRMATDHLIQQGCRKMVHIVDFEDRYEGYCKALRENKIALDKTLIFREGEAVFTYDRGCRTVEFMLNSGIEFDGVVAQSDEEAMGVMNTLLDRGLRVPEDVRVIGMDNAPYCNFARTSLSSVSQSGSRRGRIAFDMLMALIDGKTVDSMTILPRLYARNSTL